MTTKAKTTRSERLKGWQERVKAAGLARLSTGAADETKLIEAVSAPGITGAISDPHGLIPLPVAAHQLAERLAYNVARHMLCQSRGDHGYLLDALDDLKQLQAHLNDLKSEG